MKPGSLEDRYLGDGVYASYDGYHVWLDLRAQDGTTRIALEPPVLAELDRYRQDIDRLLAAQGKAEPGKEA